VLTSETEFVAPEIRPCQSIASPEASEEHFSGEDFQEQSMSHTRRRQVFKVKLTLQAAGPIRSRTKHKEHKLLRAEGCITLPFVPYPGLYLTMEKPRKRGLPETLYLRVRTVEWAMPAQNFECVVDEILGSHVFMETLEVRESPRYEEAFVELQRTLARFGFDVRKCDAISLALNKYADGSRIEPPEILPYHPLEPNVRRHRGSE
jgi:hypothetical protein